MLVFIYNKGLTIWLVILFVAKLVKVHKQDDGKRDNSRLVHIATKTALLCCISTIAYISSMMAAAVLADASIYAHFIWEISLLIDMYSSFLCVLLSFGRFNDLYFRLCGKLHACCLFINKRQFGNTDEKMTAKTLDSPKPTLSSISVRSNTVNGENAENAESAVNAEKADENV